MNDTKFAKFFTASLFTTLLMLLTACGGGSGGSGGDNGGGGITDPNIGIGFNQARGFNDQVLAIALANDGSGDIYAVGDFTSYSSTPIGHIARFNSDGSLDTDFNSGSGISGFVKSIAIAADGKIYVGGRISGYNGISRQNIVRLNTDGTLDTGFDSSIGFNDDVNSIAIAADGKIYAGGDFTSYKGETRQRIARLNSDGSLDADFDSSSGFDEPVNSITIAMDGKIYAGGDFTNYGLTPRQGVARLNTNGSVDTAFNSSSGFTGGGVNSIVLATDGKLYAGGSFTSYGLISRQRIARLNNDGTLDAVFDSSSGFNDSVNSVAIAPDGSGAVFIGGDFPGYQSTARRYIARLNANGSLDTIFDSSSGFNGDVYSLVITAEGLLYAAGNFTTYKGESSKHLTRLNSIDANSDTGFDIRNEAGFDGSVVSVVPADDGSNDVYVGGVFTTYSGNSRQHIARLNSDGSVDAGFDSSNGFSGEGVYSLATAANGQLYVGGWFSSYDGLPCQFIARLNTDGSLDTDFVNHSNGFANTVDSIAVAADGKIYLGGRFTSHNGTIRQHIARLNADGSLDASFDSSNGFNGPVNSIAIAADGKVYVGGNFGTYGGIARQKIARLNTDGSLDANFDSSNGFNGNVNSLVIAPDGKFYAGGKFTTYHGMPSQYIARLNSDGTLDNSFDSNTGFNNEVKSIQIDTDGKLYVGGRFSLYRGEMRSGIARLNSDGSLDANFESSSFSNISIQSVAIANDGSRDVFMGGFMRSYKTATVDYIARLNPDASLN